MEYLKSYKIVIITAFVSAVIILFVYGWSNFRVSEKKVMITDFNSINAGGLMNVYLKKGDKPAVVIRADDFILDKIKVEVIDGELRIDTQDGIHGERVTDAYVTYTSLNHIKVTSTIISQDVIKSNSLTIETSGSSETKLRLDCDSLRLDMKNSGNVQLAGNTNFFQFSIEGVGDLMAYHLVSKNCVAKLDTGDQSPGIARINVSDSISANINGPRYIYYLGNPFIKKEIIIGNGRLVRK